jgi:hypothetical protein
MGDHEALTILKNNLKNWPWHLEAKFGIDENEAAAIIKDIEVLESETNDNK